MKVKNKKRTFWILFLVFGFWSLLVWSFLWLEGSKLPEGETMMGASMASMMAGHARNLSLKEIIIVTQTQGMADVDQRQDQKGHHGQGILNEVYYLSTVILYLSLPIIIGGAIFLFVTWV